MKKEQLNDRKGERGNVLFLILIAVALFAALSYAVTQSTRSGGGDAQKETNKLGSAQITQYPASLRTSIIRMVIGNQDVNTLEFNTPTDYDNCFGGAGGTHSRCVFHPSGGQATYVQIPGDLMASNAAGDWVFNGENAINLIGTSSGADAPTTATADLIAYLPGVATSVCESINEELGIAGGTIPAETGIVFTSASSMVDTDGSSPTSIGATGATIGLDVTSLDGHPFGCFSQGGSNVYFHVLIER